MLYIYRITEASFSKRMNCIEQTSLNMYGLYKNKFFLLDFTLLNTHLFDKIFNSTVRELFYSN